jgi:hypothetical protein
MPDDPRHDWSGKSDERRAPDKDQQHEHSTERPALTRREREERWPIG